MGRLENFVLHLKPHKMVSRGGSSFIEFDSKNSHTVSPAVANFLSYSNGGYSLKEVFLILLQKGEAFSVQETLETLKVFANQGLINNASKFLETLKGSKSQFNANAVHRDYDQSYFSVERVVALIQKTTLFLKCDGDAAETLLESATLERWNQGDQPIVRGTRSSDFFILLSGEVGVFSGYDLLAELGPLSVFGESAAVFNQERNADVICTANAWALRVDASKVLDTEGPDSLEVFKGLKSRLILNKTLSSNPLFSSLPTDVMQFFISHCQVEKYPKERPVVTQGEPSSDFYFILKGSVSVVKDGIPVVSLKEGDHFGEVAALYQEPRSASVITESECVFLTLSQKSLFEVFCSHFKLATEIEKKATERRNSTSNLLEIFDTPLVSDEATNGDDEKSLITHNSMLVDDDVIEATCTNFNLEMIDFSSNILADQDEDDTMTS